LADRKKKKLPQKPTAFSRRELVARLSEAEETLRAKPVNLGKAGTFAILTSMRRVLSPA